MFDALAATTPPRRQGRRRPVNLSIERSLQLQLPTAILLVTGAVGIGLAAYAAPAFAAAGWSSRLRLSPAKVAVRVAWMVGPRSGP